MLGAYLIGKKRKAEKTGEGFVFKSVFYVLVMTLLMLVVGLTTIQTYDNKSISWAVILPLAFVIYSALEVSQNNGFKGFWKTVIRFAAVTGACAAFMAVIRETGSFGYYKVLPTESSIKEVRVAGDYFYSSEWSMNVTYHTYRSDESVSAILNEHKKLLETDGLKTGHKLIIAYTTRGGGEVRRGYTVENNEDDDLPIENFSDTVNGLQEFDPSVLGVLGGSDFSEWTVEYSLYGSDKDVYIREDKVAELAEILRNDIRNYYFDNALSKENTVGVLRFRGSGEYYLILNVYEATLEFLNDPANFEDRIEANSIEYFNVIYRTKEEGVLSEISVTVSTSDTRECAKELLSYIVPTHNINHTPPCFIIEDSNRDGMYKITDEKAVIKAMLELFRENNTQRS